MILDPNDMVALRSFAFGISDERLIEVNASSAS